LKISHIKTEPPFSTLFSIGDNTLADIVKSMQVNGYDDAQPVVIWGDVLIDGHTRLKAAAQIGLEEIPVSEKYFTTEDEALDYAIGRQRERRHLTDAELARCLAELDKRREHGGNRRSEDFKAQRCALKKSSAESAALLGISARKVEQIRTINDHAPEEIKKALDSGEKTVNKAYKETQEYRNKNETKTENKPIMSKRQQNAIPPALGLHQAQIAIVNLERIAKNDSKRAEGINKVQEWINANA